jgi:hypothetical protein
MPRCIYQQGDPYSTLKVLCTQLHGTTQNTPVAKCSKYKACLPTFKPKEELYNKWINNFKPESDMYKVCKYCSDYSSKSHNDNSEKQ